MSFRSRISIATSVAVAVTVIVASFLVYFAARDSMRDEIDSSIRNRARVVKTFYERVENRDKRNRQDKKSKDSGQNDDARPQPGSAPPVGVRPPRQGKLVGDEGQAGPPPPRFGGPEGIAQTIKTNGDVELGRASGPELPVSSKDKEVAAGNQAAFFSDKDVEGEHLRAYTAPLRSGVAFQIARPLDEVDNQLNQLLIILIVISAAGVVIAFVLGRVVSGTALTPVSRLMDSVEHVSATHDLGERIDVEGTDELARLAKGFNLMLEELDEADHAQRQLVADASHELRTPLASLKTNIEVLARPEQLSEGHRKMLLKDVVGQLDEFTALVTDLIDLARGYEPDGSFQDVNLDRLVAEAVKRAERQHPEITFKSDLHECLTDGAPQRLDRAVSNMIDNAAKWSPKGGVVEVSLKDCRVSVRDHGPGINEKDLPHIFDRFYRSTTARSMSGSGLGLSIVKQVADAHKGTVTARNAADGGAILELLLKKDLD